LRAAQDLGAFEVDQVEYRADRARDVDAVEVETDAGVGVEQEVDLADAADEVRAGAADAGNALSLRDDEVGRDLLESLCRSNLSGLERVATHRGDRDRRVLQVFLAFARRDDDLLDDLRVTATEALGPARLGQRRTGCENGRNGARNGQER
jgi:hypothetical protein